MDNCSSDGTASLVEKEFDWVKVVRSGKNLGYAGGINLGARYAKGDYVAVLNPDTEVDKHWLRQLVEPLEQNHKIGLSTSKVLYYSQRDVVNTCGNLTHFTGLTFCRGLGEASDRFSTPEIVPAVSGASFMIRRELLDQLGGMDPDYFLYLEDTDISCRSRLSGYDIVFSPKSIVYHRYGTLITEQKVYYLERNRYVLLLKIIGVKNLLRILPAVMLTELITWVYAISRGRRIFESKLASYTWFLTEFGAIYRRRRMTDPGRVFFRLLSCQIPFEMFTNSRFVLETGGKIANRIYHAYHNVLVSEK